MRPEPQSLEEAKARHLEDYYTVTTYPAGFPPFKVPLGPDVIRDARHILSSATPRPWGHSGLFSPDDPEKVSTSIWGPREKPEHQSGEQVFPTPGRLGITTQNAKAVVFAVNHIGAALSLIDRMRRESADVERALGLVNLERDPWALGQGVEIVGPTPMVGAIQRAGDIDEFFAWRSVTGLLFQRIFEESMSYGLAHSVIRDDFKERHGCTPDGSMLAMVNANRAHLGLEPQEAH